MQKSLETKDNASNVNTEEHNISQPEHRENGLTARQMLAAELLATGKKIIEVAQIIGVNRRQIWLWKQNPYFISAITKCQADIWQNSKKRLRGLLEQSINVIEKAIDGGDVKVAIEMIRIVGLHGRVGAPEKVLSIDEVLTIQAKDFVDELVSGFPTGTPTEKLSFQLYAKPVLIQEQYLEMKQQLEMPSDGSDDYAGE